MYKTLSTVSPLLHLQYNMTIEPTSAEDDKRDDELAPFDNMYMFTHTHT